MKKLLFSLSLLISSVAFGNPTYILLQYDFGNQITRSRVTILSSGLIMSSESLHGKATHLADKHLSKDDLQALRSDLEQAARAGTPVYREGHPTLFGSMSGSLIVNTQDGYQSTIYAIEPNRENPLPPDARDSVVYQPGPEAKSIVERVNALVSEKMPTDLISDDCGSPLDRRQ